jgi:hypothetical protein
MRLSPPAALLATLCAALLTPIGSARAADPRPVATLTADVPISAQGGWVAYSVPAAGGYRLVAVRDGVVHTLPVAPRGAPFDVDLGTDAGGRVVATFSRCSAPGDTPWSGRDCRLRTVDLESGVERAIRVVTPPGASDSSPSMWGGNVVFARHDRAHGDIDQVLYRRTGHSALRRLPHGNVPKRCPFRGGCKTARYSGDVIGMDLGSRVATFRWSMIAPSVIGHGGYEVRAVRLSTGRSSLVGSGYSGEVCTEGTDGVFPLIPSADGSRVWFGRIELECYVGRTSIVRADVGSRRGRDAPLAGTVIELARDGARLYALRAPTPEHDTSPVCDAPDAPCVLEQIETPKLGATFPPQHSPVF